MAFVRTRKTSSGATSTALVESYRDPRGRPRQRILANLYGASSTLEAVARLAAQRAELKDRKAELASQVKEANQFYKVVMDNITHGHKYTLAQQAEIAGLLRRREQVLAEVEGLDSRLAEIQREGAIVKKHCTATPAEIQAAIKAYQHELGTRQAMVALMQAQIKEAKAQLRHLSRGKPEDTGMGKFLADLMTGVRS